MSTDIAFDGNKVVLVKSQIKYVSICKNQFNSNPFKLSHLKPNEPAVSSPLWTHV